MLVTSPRPPVSFRLAKWLQRNGIRGGHRLEQMSHDRGDTNVCVTYPIGKGISFAVPLALRSYDEIHVRNYESLVVDAFIAEMRAVPGDYTFFDCGADLGLMCCRIAAAEPSIKRVVAFEPNSKIFGYLERNIASLPIKAAAVNSAVADFVGQGEMHFPEHDNSSDHARFLVRDDNGTIPVTSIDAQNIAPGGNVVIKIDVEGGEMAVIDGAARTLAEANHFIVVFEAQRDQVERTGIDPTEIVARIAAICPVDVSIADAPDKTVDWTKPFFPQVGLNTVSGAANTYDICVVKRR